MTENTFLQPWHRVGHLVVCIDPTPVPNPCHPLLALREVLDIAAVHVSPQGWAYLAFAQHERPGGLPYFPAGKFRPVAPTSIEVFRSERVPA